MPFKVAGIEEIEFDNELFFEKYGPVEPNQIDFDFDLMPSHEVGKALAPDVDLEGVGGDPMPELPGIPKDVPRRRLDAAHEPTPVLPWFEQADPLSRFHLQPIPGDVKREREPFYALIGSRVSKGREGERPAKLIKAGAQEVAKSSLLFMKMARETKRTRVAGGNVMGYELSPVSAKWIERALKSDMLKPDPSYRRPAGVAGYVEDVFKMSFQVMAQLAITATAGPGAGATFMGVQIAGSKYGQLIEKGVDPQRAAGAAIVDALLQAPLEQIGLNKALKFWKPSAASGGILKAMAASGMTEFITEWIQQYPDAVTTIWGEAEKKGQTPQEQVDEFLKGFWETTKEGMYQGAVAAPFGIMIGGTGATVAARIDPETGGFVPLASLERETGQQWPPADYPPGGPRALPPSGAPDLLDAPTESQFINIHVEKMVQDLIDQENNGINTKTDALEFLRLEEKAIFKRVSGIFEDEMEKAVVEEKVIDADPLNEKTMEFFRTKTIKELVDIAEQARTELKTGVVGGARVEKSLRDKKRHAEAVLDEFQVGRVADEAEVEFDGPAGDAITLQEEIPELEGEIDAISAELGEVEEVFELQNEVIEGKYDFLLKAPEEYTPEFLRKRSTKELKAIAGTIGVPMSGTQAKLSARIIDALEIRKIVADEDAESLANEHTAKQLTAMLVKAGKKKLSGVNKYGKAATLINWRNSTRLEGRRFLGLEPPADVKTPEQEAQIEKDSERIRGERAAAEERMAGFEPGPTVEAEKLGANHKDVIAHIDKILKRKKVDVGFRSQEITEMINSLSQQEMAFLMAKPAWGRWKKLAAEEYAGGSQKDIMLARNAINTIESYRQREIAEPGSGQIMPPEPTGAPVAPETPVEAPTTPEQPFVPPETVNDSVDRLSSMEYNLSEIEGELIQVGRLLREAEIQVDAALSKKMAVDTSGREIDLDPFDDHKAMVNIIKHFGLMSEGAWRARQAAKLGIKPSEVRLPPEWDWVEKVKGSKWGERLKFATRKDARHTPDTLYEEAQDLLRARFGINSMSEFTEKLQDMGINYEGAKKRAPEAQLKQDIEELGTNAAALEAEMSSIEKEQAQVNEWIEQNHPLLWEIIKSDPTAENVKRAIDGDLVEGSQPAEIDSEPEDPGGDILESDETSFDFGANSREGVLLPEEAERLRAAGILTDEAPAPAPPAGELFTSEEAPLIFPEKGLGEGKRYIASLDDMPLGKADAEAEFQRSQQNLFDTADKMRKDEADDPGEGGTPAAGLSIKQVREDQAEYNAEKATGKSNFTDPEVRQRIAAARGLPRQSVTQGWINYWKDWWQRWGRWNEHLDPRDPYLANYNEWFKNSLKYGAISQENALRLTGGVIRSLNKDQVRLLSDKAVIENEMWNFQNDKALSFDLTPENIDAQYDHINNLVNADKKVYDAWEMRQQLMANVRNAEIAAMKVIGIDLTDTYGNPSYFRQQVIAKAQELHLAAGVAAKRGKIVKRGHKMAREGGHDYNTFWFEAENEVLSKMMYDTFTARFINMLEVEGYNVLPELKKQARKDNDQNIWPHFENMAAQQAPIETKDGVKRVTAEDLYRQILNKKIAIGISKINSLAAGRVKDYPGLPDTQDGRWSGLIEVLGENARNNAQDKAAYKEIHDTIEGWYPTPMAESDMKELMSYFGWLRRNAEADDPALLAAKTFHKGIREKQEKMKRILGDEYVDPSNPPVPEGYSEHFPGSSRVFFTAYSIPEAAAMEVLTEAMESIEVDAEMIRKVMAMGGKGKRLVVRDDINASLNDMSTKKVGRDDLHKRGIKAWKMWQLISPTRFAKYNIRNLTGDAERVFVGNPETFKFAWGAVGDLYHAFRTTGPMAQDLYEFFDMGAFEGTMQYQEISDLKMFDRFAKLFEEGATPTEKTLKVFKSYWRKARLTTDFRELALRYAAYKSFLTQMRNNKDGLPDHFGGSNVKVIAAISDIKRRAYRLSNDMLGAYDEISLHGQWLRERAYPFWSWKEVNFKFYKQVLVNAHKDKALMEEIGRKAAAQHAGARAAAALTARGAVKLGSFYLRVAALTAILSTWNNLMFPDEEDNLPEGAKNRLHIILPHIEFKNGIPHFSRRNEKGEVIAFTNIGALGDLLGWVGLDAFYQHISDISHGRKTIKEVVVEMAKAPVNTVAQGSFPFVKLAGEIITRRATFPDVFEPRTVRDPWYHIAQSFGLDKEFKWLTGAPVAGGRTIENPVLGMPEGFIRNWSNLFVYHYNPGVSSYGATLGLLQKFKRKIGKGGEGFWLSPVHNVLYNYRLALKAPDKAAAARFLIEYQKITGIGGNELKTVMRRQIKNLFPLAGLNRREALVFIAQLDYEQRQRLNNAILYWFSVISGIQYNDLRLQVLEKYGVDMSSYRKGGK